MRPCRLKRLSRKQGGKGGYAAATTGLYGITATSAEADGECVVYLTGAFFADGLVLETGVAADDLEAAFRNIGIFLK